MFVVIVATTIFVTIGCVLNQWWTLIIPFLTVPLLYLLAWERDGLGDGWQYGLMIVLAVALASTALGIVTRRGWRELKRHRARRQSQGRARLQA